MAKPLKNDDKPRPVEVLNFDTTAVSKTYVPEGFKSREDFLADMRDEYNMDFEYDRVNREEAIEDKKFAAGMQWDPIVLRQREGLPCLVINSVPQFVAQLVGDWRENKRGIKVLPTEDGDTDLSDVRDPVTGKSCLRQCF